MGFTSQTTENAESQSTKSTCTPIQCVYPECLLCAEHDCKHLGSIREQNRQRSVLGGGLFIGWGKKGNKWQKQVTFIEYLKF